jgi:hypothetical protein
MNIEHNNISPLKSIHQQSNDSEYHLRSNAVELEQPAEVMLQNKTLYHGSATADIELLRPAEEDTVGRGIYFVDNPIDAAGYASLRSKRDNNPPIFYEARVDDARVVNLDNPEKLQEVMHGFADSLEKQDTSTLPWYVEGAIQRAIETIQNGVLPGQVKLATQNVCNQFTQFLQRQGFDGLITSEGGEGAEVGNHVTYLLFDSKKVTITDQHSLNSS